MAIKDIIARGIGFSPGSVKFIPTAGFVSVPAVPFVGETPPRRTFVPQRNNVFKPGTGQPQT